MSKMKILLLALYINLAFARNVWECRNDKQAFTFGPSFQMNIEADEWLTCVYEGKPLTVGKNAFKVTFQDSSKGLNMVGVSGFNNNDCTGFYYNGSLVMDRNIIQRDFGKPINYESEGPDTITVVFDKKPGTWDMDIIFNDGQPRRAYTWSTDFGPYYPAVCLQESANVTFVDIPDTEAKKISSAKTSKYLRTAIP